MPTSGVNCPERLILALRGFWWVARREARDPGAPERYHSADGRRREVPTWTLRRGCWQGSLNLNLNLPRFRLHPYTALGTASSACLAPSSSRLRFPSAEWILTLLQEHSMYSKASGAARSRASACGGHPPSGTDCPPPDTSATDTPCPPPFPVSENMPKRNSMCQRQRGRFRFTGSVSSPRG